MPQEVDLDASDVASISNLRDKKIKEYLKIGELYATKHKFQEMIDKVDADLQKELRQNEVYIQEEKELIQSLSEKYGSGQADPDRKKFIKND